MMKNQNEQFFSIYIFSIESARIQINFLSGDVSSLCDAWENKKTEAFHGDRDQINYLCCTCCPFDSLVLRLDYTK